MRRLLAACSFVALLCGAAPAVAQQGTVSGTIRSDGGAALSGVEVRAYEQGAFLGKVPAVRGTTSTAANGAFSINVDPGTYYLFARDPAGGYVDEFLGDTSVVEAATTTAVGAGASLAGLDLSLAASARIEGIVLGPSGLGLNGIYVLCHSEDNPLLVHQEVTHWNAVDGYFQCGGLPAHTFRVYAYDSGGSYASVLAAAPVTLAAGELRTGLSLSMTWLAGDPYEPNSRAGPTAISLPFTSSSTSLAGTEVDAFAFDGLAGQRIGVTTSGPFPGCLADTVVAIFDPGGTVVAIDDDGAGGLHSNTEVQLQAAGRYQVVVGSYPDLDLDGTGGLRRGEYTVLIEQRNAAPTLEVREVGGFPVTDVNVLEGQHLQLTAVATDPEGDPLTLSAGPLPTNSTFNAAAGLFAFDPDFDQAAGSPYLVTFRAADPGGETARLVSISVLNVNRAPESPTISEPAADGDQVGTALPQLVATTTTDPDGDALVYRFVLDTTVDFSSPGAVSSADLAEGPPGSVVFVPPAPLVENGVYFLRAAAFDGQLEGPPAVRRFVMDAVSEPPPTPAILEPTQDEALSDPLVTFTIQGVVDPDGDAVTYDLQVAVDDAFGAPIAAPTGIPPGSPDATFTLPGPLTADRTYFARARAVDARGLRSVWSASVRFSIGEGGAGGSGAGGTGGAGGDGSHTGGRPTAPPPPANGAAESGCGCGAGGEGSAGSWLLLALCALAFAAGRRRPS